jgi:hypothetical protein
VGDEAAAVKVVSAVGVWRLLSVIGAIIAGTAVGTFWVMGIISRLDRVEENQAEIKADVAAHSERNIHPLGQGMIDGLRIEVGHLRDDQTSQNEAVLEEMRRLHTKRRKRRR